jgi:hypothetical protein
MEKSEMGNTAEKADNSGDPHDYYVGSILEREEES